MIPEELNFVNFVVSAILAMLITANLTGCGMAVYVGDGGSEIGSREYWEVSESEETARQREANRPGLEELSTEEQEPAWYKAVKEKVKGFSIGAGAQVRKAEDKVLRRRKGE